MTIELILAEDIPNIAKTGDSVLLKDNNTFEIKKLDEKLNKDKYPKDYIPDADEPVTRTERDKDGKPLETNKPNIEKDYDIQKPFAGYKDFADCVAHNRDKGDPDAYCGSIKHKVEKSEEIEKIEESESDRWDRSRRTKDREEYSKMHERNKDMAQQTYDSSIREGKSKNDALKRVRELHGEDILDYITKSNDPIQEDVEKDAKVSHQVNDYADEQARKQTEEAHRIAREKAIEHAKKVEKFLPPMEDKTKAWQILTKFYTNGHLDSNKILKDYLYKLATCPNVSEQFDKIMVGWMTEGEADTSAIEKIINSCKKEGGNVEKSVDEIDKEKGAAHSSHEHKCPLCQHDTNEMPEKMRERLEGKKVEKSDEIIKEVINKL